MTPPGVAVHSVIGKYIENVPDPEATIPGWVSYRVVLHPGERIVAPSRFPVPTVTPIPAAVEQRTGRMFRENE